MSRVRDAVLRVALAGLVLAGGAWALFLPMALNWIPFAPSLLVASFAAAALAFILGGGGLLAGLTAKRPRDPRTRRAVAVAAATLALVGAGAAWYVAILCGWGC